MVTTVPDERAEAGSRVLPLVSDQGNRRMLVEWIDDHPDFETVDLTDGIEETAFDVAILDKATFQEYLEPLRAKKTAAAPVVLPYLLLLPESDSEIIATDAGQLADNVVTETIDELVTLPIKQSELHWRLSSLLRLRNQSLTLRNNERELERQVDLFEKAQDMTNVGAWEYNISTDEAWWTEQALRIHALPEDTPASPDLSFQHYHPDDRPIIEDAFAAAVEEGEPYDIEVRFIDAEDNHRWVRTIGEPKYDDGTLTRVRGTIQDITERKERVRRLERYEEIVEAASDVLWMFSGDFSELLFVNSPYEDLFGQPISTLEENPLAFIEAIHPDDRDLARRKIDNLSGGEPIDVELRVNPNEDFDRWVWIKGDAVYDDEGNQFAVSGFSRDITDRKAQEQRLRRIRRSVEASGHAIYITDPDGTIQYVNPAFETVTGFSADEAIGENPRILKSGEMPDEYYDDLWETVLAGEVWEETLINQRKDGELYHAHQTIAPVKDDNGEIDSFVAIQTDITKRRQLEDRLRESIRHLQVIDRVLRHNLHNDMNVIQGYAETIRDATSDEIADYAGHIVDESDKLLTTVDKEREITELLADPEPTEPRDVVPLIGSLAEHLREEFTAADISLDLPAEATVSVTSRLDLAIDELVRNAIVHSDRDRPQVEVSITETSEAIELQVADDGPGIPEMEQKILTEEAEIEPLYHGSGLGLWLVHLIVEESDGMLSFEANEPRGSIVTIELPSGSPKADRK